MNMYKHYNVNMTIMRTEKLFIVSSYQELAQRGIGEKEELASGVQLPLCLFS